MESKETIEEKLKEELAYSLGIHHMREFPIIISVQQEELPDIERWTKDE